MPDPRPAAHPRTPSPARHDRPMRVVVTAAPQLEPAADDHRPGLQLVAAGSRAPGPTAAPTTAGPARLASTPDPAAIVGARQVLRLALEVQEGRRSPAQLRPLLTPAALEIVVRLARERGRTRQVPGRLNVVHVQQLMPGIAETFATVSRGARVEAVAARLELTTGRWLCTALRLR